MHCILLYCTVLYCTVLYCNVLYCTVLYCTALHCTVRAPNIMRELCGNHTLSLSPSFHPLSSFTAYPKLPNLFPTFHPFPSFPPSPPRLAQFPIDFILISYCFSYYFLWFPVDLNPPIRSSDQSRDKSSKYYA